MRDVTREKMSAEPLLNRVAVVTGGASGIGRSCVETLLKLGAVPVAVDLDADRLQDAYSETSVSTVVADVSVESDVARAISEASRFGCPEILVNAAAALSPQIYGRDSDVAAMDVSVWDATMAVNLRGPMLMCKYAVGYMAANGRGAIINIGSGAASAGNVAKVAYAASKAGIVTMSQYIATAYGQFGIRCNVVAPGMIMTDAAVRGTPEDRRERVAAEQLVPRLGRPGDIAEVVAFLASDAAGFVTGQTWSVDGGLGVHQAAMGRLSEPPAVYDPQR